MWSYVNQAKGSYEYFITFTDDYSRCGYVYLMRRKSEAFEKFKEFRAEVKNQLGKRIKAIRSNRDGEYLLRDFKDYLTQNGIVSQLATPRTPQQNGVAKRRNMTLLEMVRSMMSYSTLPISFWGYTLKIAMHILTLASSKSVPNTPKELWSGYKPSMKYLHIWGCLAHVLKRKSDKLEAKTEVCMFLGYSKETKGYLFYNHKDNKVFVSTRANFLEDNYVNNFNHRNKVVLVEMNESVNEQPMDETRDDVVVLDTPQDTTHEVSST